MTKKQGNPNPSPATRFTSENQPANPGRKPGVKTTQTILKKFLNAEMEQLNPFTKELEKMSVQELMNLVQIKKAMEGDLAAFKELTDRYEGPVTKVIESNATLQVKEFDITKLYDAEETQEEVEPPRIKK